MGVAAVKEDTASRVRCELDSIVSFLNDSLLICDTKEGDIKIDIECVRLALSFMRDLQGIISNNLGVLDEREQETLDKSLDFYNFLWASTIGIGALRYQQAEAFNCLKKLDTFNDVQACEQGIDLDELKSKWYEEYMKVKNNREILAKKLEEVDFNYFREQERD